MNNNKLFLEYIKTIINKDNYLFKISDNYLNTIEINQDDYIFYDFHSVLYNGNISIGYYSKCRKNAGRRKVYSTKKGLYFNNYGREYLKDYKTYDNIVKFLEAEEV